MADFSVGEIRTFPYTYIPRGWKACNGEELLVSQHRDLYTLIGNTFGGDGHTTFKLPDLRNHCIIGEGQGPGLANRTFGKSTGQSAVALSIEEIPAHTHDFQAVNTEATASEPNMTNMLSAQTPEMIYGDSSEDVNMPSGTITSTGLGQPHENCQPYLRLQYCILVGVPKAPS